MPGDRKRERTGNPGSVPQPTMCGFTQNDKTHQWNEQMAMTNPPAAFADPENQIAMCGVFCGGCPVYRVRCYGCRSTDRGSLQKRTSKWNCKKRACVLEQSLNHCGECAKLSCTLRKPIERRYLQSYNIDLEANCRQIKLLGAQAWITSQRQKYTCPRCGQPFIPYDLRCTKCNPSVGKKP